MKAHRFCPWLFLLLSACSLDPVFTPGTTARAPLYPPPGAPAPRIENTPLPVPPPAVQPPPREVARPPAPPVVALMRQAEGDRRRGDLERAAARLERALRIQPDYAPLWHELARIRLRQDQPRLAEELAKKSIALAGGDRRLLCRNWSLIAEARRRRGDIPGAREAERLAARNCKGGV